MRNSKVFTLLKGLPAKELKKLKEEVKTHKRKTLNKLFIVLIPRLQSSEPDSSEVFKAVFGKTYTKKLDYLLRNEYRLLYEWMVEELLARITRSQVENSIDFLTLLLGNKQYELFEEEYKLFWKQAIQTDDVDFMLRLTDLNIRFHLEGKPQSLSNAEQTAQLSQKRIELLQLSTLRHIRAEEIRLKMSERIISAYRPLPQLTSSLSNIDLQKLQQNDLYSQYLSLRGNINSAKGKQKIELLQSVLKNEEIIRKYETTPEEALCRFWANLAQEYYLASDFENAVENYYKAEPQLKSLPIPLQETFILNYAMALMRNGNLGEARTLATAHEQLLLNSKILAGRSHFLLAVLNLYARKADMVEKYVKLESKKEGSEFYFFMRLVLSGVYYLRGDLDLAVRESINLDQAVNYELNREQTLQTRISKPIVSLFRRFYSTLQGSTKEELKKELKLLNKEIEVGLNSDNDQSPNSILVHWISKEILHALNQFH